MFNLIQLQDRLRGFSEDQLKQFLQRPDPNIPDFMVMAALDEKNDAKAQEAQMKAQQPSVREEMLAVAGLPAMEAGRMASSMAPKSDVRTNTGGDDMMTMARLAEDMPMEDDMEEDEELDIVETPVRRASFGGLMQLGRMEMAAPLARDMMYRPPSDRKIDFENMLQQGRGFRSGLDNLGRDISGRVQGRTEEEVQDFVGEVGNMAQERFDVNLSEPSMAQRQQEEVRRGMFGGKGMPPMRMAMKEGGLAGMYFGGRPGNLNPFLDFSGNFIPKVKPRPPSSSIYVDKGTVINEQEEWDKNEGKYYNIDGTLKDEFKQNVASTATDTSDQKNVVDSVRDAQRMMDINEIPEPPKKDDDKKPPPGTDDPAPRGFLSDLTASLDKMREDQKEQMEKNQALGLMLEGIKLSRRGVIDEESGKGLMFGQQQTQKVQDRLAQLQGLEAKIKIAGANIAQKDRAVEAAIKKATAKSGLSAKDALARYTALSTKIIELETDLNRDDLVLDETKKAALENSLAGLKRVKERLEGQALGLMGDNILDNEFLKELYEVTTPKKEDK